VIFGFGNYLSDIIDNIHHNHGTVAMVVNNIEPTVEQRQNLDTSTRAPHRTRT
jgi:hypothetical protein